MGLGSWIQNLFKKSKEVKEIVEDENTSDNREELEKELDEEQKQINLLYVSDGLTDEVLEKQVALNARRNELNIPDKKELVDGWSQ